MRCRGHHTASIVRKKSKTVKSKIRSVRLKIADVYFLKKADNRVAEWRAASSALRSA